MLDWDAVCLAWLPRPRPSLVLLIKLLSPLNCVSLVNVLTGALPDLAVRARHMCIYEHTCALAGRTASRPSGREKKDKTRERLATKGRRTTVPLFFFLDLCSPAKEATQSLVKAAFQKRDKARQRAPMVECVTGAVCAVANEGAWEVEEARGK